MANNLMNLILQWSGSELFIAYCQPTIIIQLAIIVPLVLLIQPTLFI